MQIIVAEAPQSDGEGGWYTDNEPQTLTLAYVRDGSVCEVCEALTPDWTSDAGDTLERSNENKPLKASMICSACLNASMANGSVRIVRVNTEAF